MGTWGHNAFENDDAAEWADQLTGASVADSLDAPGMDLTALDSQARSLDDVSFLTAALERGAASSADALDDFEASAHALAAAEVVAALLGRPGDLLPEDVADWAEERQGQHGALAPLAQKAIARIRTASELKRLWDEGDGGDWYASLDDLAHRLTQTTA